ncbi:TetR/AcrR family transcriptional regulator C-terminal domain-containing protein [Kutzneria kofuensis]|uniref:AcrR family transcriptional regulator n=1 Tax=Kutzneria kofuensis TaxID=103725 RepID=A0A7W9KDJ2_9PSEU|nr:TetR/AcrR family transcriptional regulator C-terminal domain-containing protein [Kutzneria kofuensis]MBB5890208.1 AcrR family transcriptional regulator [Kutzneria kofuensis]
METTARTRVPRNTLSAELVVTAALTLLDRVGVEAFSVRALAKDLGVAPMTLYTYFRGKDELLDAVRDHALGAATLTTAYGGWQHQVRTICRRLRGQILEHPCLTALLQQRPLAGHESAESSESLLRALVEAGFNAENAARAYTTVLGFVVGVTTLEVRLLEENRDPERREKVRQIMTGLPAERYPTLVEHAAALRQTVGGDAQFEFGLDLLIAGMEQRLILSP